MKLSDLAPGDVAVFEFVDDMPSSDSFVVGGVYQDDDQFVNITFSSGHGSAWHKRSPVRRLGRGRLIPARIVMDGEPDEWILCDKCGERKTCYSCYRKSVKEFCDSAGPIPVPTEPTEEIG